MNSLKTTVLFLVTTICFTQKASTSEQEALLLGMFDYQSGIIKSLKQPIERNRLTFFFTKIGRKKSKNGIK